MEGEKSTGRKSSSFWQDSERNSGLDLYLLSQGGRVTSSGMSQRVQKTSSPSSTSFTSHFLRIGQYIRYPNVGLSRKSRAFTFLWEFLCGHFWGLLYHCPYHTMTIPFLISTEHILVVVVENLEIMIIKTNSNKKCTNV